MNYQIDSKFEIPHSPEVPDEVRLDLIGQHHAEVSAQTRSLRRRAAKIQAIEKDYRAKLQKLMTAQKYERFRQSMVKEKGLTADLLFPPRRPKVSDQELARLQEERNQRLSSYLKRLGVDIERLKALNKETLERVSRLMRQPKPKRKGKPVQILLPSEVPERIREERTNPWTLKKPPYDGWGWWYFGAIIAGFTFTPTLFLNSAAGLIGNRNYLHDSDAGDWDFAEINYQTMIGMWYKMPSAGIIEVYVNAQPSWNEHYCHLYDEWGWSWSKVLQWNYFTLQVDTGSRVFAQTSDWWQKGYTEGHWVLNYLKNGHDYWYHLYSSDAYPKGAWVVVWIGTRNTNMCWANDVEVYSRLDFRWFVKKVFLRSTGG